VKPSRSLCGIFPPAFLPSIHPLFPKGAVAVLLACDSCSYPPPGPVVEVSPEDPRWRGLGRIPSPQAATLALLSIRRRRIPEAHPSKKHIVIVFVRKRAGCRRELFLGETVRHRLRCNDGDGPPGQPPGVRRCRRRPPPTPTPAATSRERGSRSAETRGGAVFIAVQQQHQVGGYTGTG